MFGVEMDWKRNPNHITLVFIVKTLPKVTFFFLCTAGPNLWQQRRPTNEHMGKDVFIDNGTAIMLATDEKNILEALGKDANINNYVIQ